MNLHWIHDLRAAARAAGCDMLLTGAWGNASFSFGGEGALPHWFLRGHWGRLAREIRAGGDLHHVLRRFASQVVMPLLPPALWRQIRRLRHGAPDDPLTSWCPLNADYARDMRVAERAREMGYDPLYRPFRSTRAWRAAVLENATNEVADLTLALERLHGIPERDPTSYRPLVEFCLGIPDDQYLRNGQRRWLARRLLAGKVPAAVLDEPRRGVQAVDWHLRLGRQRDRLMAELDHLSEDPAMSHRLDLGGLRQALADWPAGTPLDGVRGLRLQMALTRGLTAARFIRYVEGRNDPW